GCRTRRSSSACPGTARPLQRRTRPPHPLPAAAGSRRPHAAGPGRSRAPRSPRPAAAPRPRRRRRRLLWRRVRRPEWLLSFPFSCEHTGYWRLPRVSSAWPVAFCEVAALLDMNCIFRLAAVSWTMFEGWSPPLRMAEDISVICAACPSRAEPQARDMASYQLLPLLDDTLPRPPLAPGPLANVAWPMKLFSAELSMLMVYFLLSWMDTALVVGCTDRIRFLLHRRCNPGTPRVTTPAACAIGGYPPLVPARLPRPAIAAWPVYALHPRPPAPLPAQPTGSFPPC